MGYRDTTPYGGIRGSIMGHMAYTLEHIHGEFTGDIPPFGVFGVTPFGVIPDLVFRNEGSKRGH